MANDRARLNELRALKRGVGASSQSPRQRLERLRGLKGQTRPGLVDASDEQIQAGIQGFGQGASFGFTDEISAGVNTLINDKPFSQNLEERRADIAGLKERNPEAFGVGEFTGTATSAGALGAKTLQGAKTIGQGIVRGAAQGSVIGGASGAGFADEDLDSAVLNGLEGAAKGAALGAGFTAALSAPQMIAKTVGSPAYTDALKTLSNAGVNKLTVGQASGSKAIRATETSLGEIPVAGGLINRQIKASRLQYQQALLKTAGLDDGSKLINEKTLGKARAKIEREYGNALNGKSVNITTDDFIDDLAKIEAKHSELLGFEQKKNIQTILDDVVGKAAKDTSITGREYQRLRSRMGKLAFREKDENIAELYRDVRNALDDQFQRSAPTPELAEINRRYSNLSSLEDVWKGRGASETVEGFLPPSAIAKEATRGRNTEEFKELARSGAIILPDRTPNSATATRAAILSFIGAGGGAAVGSGEVAGDDLVKLGLIGTTITGVLSRGKGLQSIVTQGAGSSGAGAAAGGGTGLVISGSN